MKNIFQKDNFIDMSIKDLIKEKKETSFIIGVIIGILIGFLGFVLFNTSNKGFAPSLVIPFGLVPIFIMAFNQFNSINRELKRRILNL